MIQSSQIGWSSYQDYSGPFFRGTAGYKLPANPTRNDKILAVITATEGGAWNAVNMYDTCIYTVGLIQWCGKQFSVDDMLGVTYERAPRLLGPMYDAMVASGVELRKTPAGRYRFHSSFAAGAVDTPDEMRRVFFRHASGKKDAAEPDPKRRWNPESQAHAKSWAAAFANVYAQPEAIETQRDFTVPRLYTFALPEARKLLEEATKHELGEAFICAFLSFAANNPKRANESLKLALSTATAAPWTLDWFVHVLERLTFAPKIAIYPHRYAAIRPVLERLFKIDLPDHAAELSGMLSPSEAQWILVHVLGHDLGPAGPNGDGVDGKWGAKSRAALLDFEKRAGVAVAEQDGMLDLATNDALKRERDRAQAAKPDLVPPAGESPEALFARVIAKQFDDIGMIRSQAIKEMSGGWESLPPADDAEESTDPQTPTARSGTTPDGMPRS